MRNHMSTVQESNESLPYRLAEEYALQTNRCLFITGKAGTGKTTFLRRLREESPKTMAVVAPTGVAAINAGGMTIHSFFQLPIRTLVPTTQSYHQLFTEQRLTQRKRNMLYHLEMLVIDEISMVRADVLDAIDAVLRRYKYRKDMPFGGVQVVMIGDLFQLSPVTRGDDEVAMAKYYAGPYFFQAKVMQELQPIYIELDHVFRQRDEQFVTLLNEVRNNRLSAQSRLLLNSRYNPDFVNSDDDFHITLTTHNRTADEINERELDKLEGREHVFRADIVKDFPESSYPTDERLTLKVGARVMFVRNDDQKPRRFYNGKIGVVADIDGEQIFVRCEDEDIEVERMEWKNIRYREDEETGNITEEILGTFTQVPLRLAWAVTIHKSQGLTFDRVMIDAARAFAAGQVYVALSRCRTLEGIVLSSPLRHVALSNDPNVVGYTQNQPELDAVCRSLPRAQKEYEIQLFSALFDFHRLLTLIEQMRKVVKEAVSFNDETIPFLQQLQPTMAAWQSVCEKFHPQLMRLLLSDDKAMLRQRITAAVQYFSPMLEQTAQDLADHPCRSKNKADVAEFEPLLSDLFMELYRKIDVMQALGNSNAPSAMDILQARSQFVAPMFELHSVMEKPSKGEKASGRKAKVKAKGEGTMGRAGERWTKEDDMRLRELYQDGKPIVQISEEFTRTRGAIRSRLKKLGLIE